MTVSGYFAFMEAVDRLADDEDAAVKMASAEGIEQSSPPICAAYCSHDGRACIGRLARCKRLIGPMEFIVHEGEGTLSVEMICGDAELRMPAFLVEVEFAFLVNLIGKATKQDISPVAAEMQEVPEDSSSAAYLGCAVEAGPRNILSFASSDRDMPFVSADDATWSYFEPELGRRLAELETDESFPAHVRSALIDALSAGECGADDIAHRLGVSRRTFQHRLSDEGATFQKQLNHARELLAEHYLSAAALDTEEIAYLLGYLELSSFLRASASWRGRSLPEWRKEHAELGVQEPANYGPLSPHWTMRPPGSILTETRTTEELA